MDYNDTTVIIPVKDEPAVGKVARDVLKALPGCKIIVIYKGMVKLYLKNKNLRVMKQTSSGKGRACVEAAKHVGTDIMCFIDGDDTYDAGDLKKVIALVRQGADMAIGDRMSHIKARAMPPYVQFGNNVLTLTGNLLFDMKLKDSQTGLRAIKSTVFKNLGLREPRFGIETEMNVKCRRKKLDIEQVPARYYTRTGVSKQFKLIDGLKLFFLNFKLLFQK